MAAALTWSLATHWNRENIWHSWHLILTRDKPKKMFLLMLSWAEKVNCFKIIWENLLFESEWYSPYFLQTIDTRNFWPRRMPRVKASNNINMAMETKQETEFLKIKYLNDWLFTKSCYTSVSWFQWWYWHRRRRMRAWHNHERSSSCWTDRTIPDFSDWKYSDKESSQILEVWRSIKYS